MMHAEVDMFLIASLMALVAQDPAAVWEEAIQPQAAVAPDGTVHVAMIRDGNIVVASSKDGTKFGEPVVAIDGGGKARGGMQRGPRIGVDAKGNLVVTAPVCFDAKELERKYPKAELWLTRSADGGKTWSKPLQVNDQEKHAPEALHWMAVDPSGDAHVAWLDTRNKGQALYYSRVGAEKAGPNVRLVDAVCECCAPGLAVDAKGNAVVAVRETGKKNDRAILIVSSRNGGKSFSDPAPINVMPTGVGG